MSDEDLELREPLKSVEGQLKNNYSNKAALYKQRVRVKRKRAACDHGIEWPPAVRLMACLVYILAGYFSAPAVAYVAHVLRKRLQLDICEDELTLHVEAAFVACDLSVVMPILDENGSTQPRHLAKAWAWYTEWQLFDWVKTKNREQGVAPTTALVLASFDRFRAIAPADFRPAPRGGPQVIGARVWARRWRLRWGARHGNLRTTEEMTVDEKQEKAPDLLANRDP